MKATEHRTARQALPAILLCAFSLLSAQRLASEGPRMVDAQVSRIHETISRLYPRPEGSKNERTLIEELTRFLAPLGYSVTVSPFADLSESHSFSSIVMARKEGTFKDNLVIAVPLNHPPKPRAEGDGSAVLSALLAALAAVSGTELETNLTVLFLGGEFGTGAEYPLGTRKFLSAYYPDGATAVLYLDIAYPPERVYIDGGSDVSVSPAWIVILVRKLLAESGFMPLFLGNANQVYRLGRVDSDTPIRWFMEEGYPAIRLSSGKEPFDGSAEEWAAAFSCFLQSFITSTPSPLPSEWDRHYLSFQARDFFVVVPELVYIIIVLLIFLGILVFPIVRRQGVKRYVRATLRHFWALPILLGIIFLCLLVGTATARLPLILRDFPNLWRHSPILFFVIKTGIAISLFSLLFYFRKFFIFSFNSSFYSSSALILLLSAVIVTALYDISLSYYFIWAFLFSFLFSAVPNRYVKAAAFLLSLYWIFKWLYDIFTFPFIKVSATLIFSWIPGNLLYSLSLLPFILMLIRLDFLFRHPRSKRQRIIIRSVTLILGGASLVTLAWLIFHSPFRDDAPQPVSVVESRDETERTRMLQFASEAPIGSFTIRSGSVTGSYDCGGRTWSIALPEMPPLIGYSISGTRFLDREYLRLRIEPEGKPESIGVTLKSEGGMIVLYDSNFPFSYDPDGVSLRFHIGVNPPLPLTVEFTIPANLSLSGEITAEYQTIPYEIDFSGEGKEFSEALRTRTRFSVETER